MVMLNGPLHRVDPRLRRWSDFVSVIFREAGGMWLPNELLLVTTSNVAVNLQSKRVLPALSGLTNREKDVLSGILDGLSNKEIAREHGITERTVKEYVGTLLHKFEAKDRISLLLRLGEFSHLKDAL